MQLLNQNIYNLWKPNTSRMQGTDFWLNSEEICYGNLLYKESTETAGSISYFRYIKIQHDSES